MIVVPRVAAEIWEHCVTIGMMAKTVKRLELSHKEGKLKFIYETYTYILFVQCNDLAIKSKYWDLLEVLLLREAVLNITGFPCCRHQEPAFSYTD